MVDNKRIPGWFLALTVLLTAAITCWLLLKKDLSSLLPGVTSSGEPTALQPALRATPGRAPAIVAGVAAKHSDLGPCTLCHTVLDRRRRPVPLLRAAATLRHQYRGGVCVNCHRIQAGLANSVQPPARATSPTPPPATRSTAPGPNAARPTTAQQQQRSLLAVQRPPRRERPTLSPGHPQRTRQLPRLALSAAPKGPPAAATGARAPSLAQQRRRRGAPARRPCCANPLAGAAWLGLIVRPLATPKTVLGTPPRGLMIAQVFPPATETGLQPGDVLLSIDGAPVPTISSFLAVTGNGTRPGAEVIVRRDGRRQTAVVGRAARASSAETAR